MASFVLILASPFPSGGASAAELTAYFTDPGNGRLIQVAMTLSSVGGGGSCCCGFLVVYTAGSLVPSGAGHCSLRLPLREGLCL